MATYSWTIPTGNIITGNTYIKDTDNKIQDTMDDLADFVNSSGAYTGQGLLFDYVDKANNQTITGVKTFSNGLIGNVTGTVSGNSGTATKLATARTITLAGDVTGSVSFDGSANASITTTVGDDSHNHSIAYIAGLQTALDGKLSTSGNAASATYATTATTATTAASCTGNAATATTAISANNGVIASSNAETGYIKFGNGLIVQWGQATTSTPGGDVTATFPIAFPNSCFQVVRAEKFTGQTWDYTGAIRSWTKTGVTASNWRIGTWHYIAIGY